MGIQSTAGGPTPDDVVGEPVATGPEVRITAGPAPVGGVPWTLSAYETDRGLCLSLEGLERHNLGGGPCGFAVSPESPVRVATSKSGDPSTTIVYGIVLDSANTVSVNFANDETRTIATIPSPAGLGSNARFYAVARTGSAVVDSVIARTATGDTFSSGTLRSGE